MTSDLSQPELRDASELVAQRLGLRFRPERLNDLERGLTLAAQALRLGSSRELLTQLSHRPPSRDQDELLGGYLTIGETYFFREQQSFSALESRVLPELIDRRRATQRIRVWSAGCSSGEEPYSLAILLRKLLPKRSGWNITVLGSDINSLALAKARHGVYRPWSFRGTPEWVTNGYFQVHGKELRIGDDIRALAHFAYLNLAQDPFPSVLNNTTGIDLIVCRNVLMYFDPPIAERVIDQFHRSLQDGGYLLISPADSAYIKADHWNLVSVPGAFFYRKADPASPCPPKLATAAQEFIVEDQRDSSPWPDNDPPAPRVKTTAAPSEPISESAVITEARRLIDDGALDQAVQVLSHCASAGSGRPQVKLLLARLLADQGRWDEALRWTDELLRHDRLNRDTHFLRATILLEQGALNSARDSLNRALYLDGAFVLGHFMLGNLYRMKDDQSRARRSYDNALRLLESTPSDEVLPGTDGLTVERLGQVIQSQRELCDGSP